MTKAINKGSDYSSYVAALAVRIGHKARINVDSALFLLNYLHLLLFFDVIVEKADLF